MSMPTRLLLLLFTISQCLIVCHSKLSAPIASNTDTDTDHGADQNQKAVVTCTTTAGPIVMLFHRSWSPRGYDRATSLFEQHYYDDSHFFRVIPNFLVQFGLSYTTDAELNRFANDQIKDDLKREDLMPFREGMMSFAGSGPNSRTSQLFIAFEGAGRLGQSPWETPFGFVLQGMDNVRKLYSGYSEGPQQGRIRQGSDYIEDNFPLLDKFETCTVKRLDDDASTASSTSMIGVPTFTLNNGITIPLVGLGSASGVTYPHIQSAIEVGYRYTDTAQSHSWGYHEEDVGKAVYDAKRRYQDSKDGSTDEYVFVQTKIHPQDLGYQSTKTAIQLSLKRLQVTSLDSILLHKPRCWEGICSHEPEGTWQDSWGALEEAVDAGLVRSIGICDVDNQLLDELLAQRIGPTVIQNWFDPFHQDKAFRQRIEQHNQQHPQQKVLYQGYSTLGTQWKNFQEGYEDNPVLNHPTLQFIAKGRGMTVPQVVIQWATRRGVMVLPASRNRSHQLSNLNSFDSALLSDEELQAIDDLDGNIPPPPLPKKKKKEANRHPEEVQLKFVNRATEGRPVNVFWVSGSNEEVPVGEMKELGDVLELTSYHGHVFVFKEGGGGDYANSSSSKKLNHHLVDRSLGAMQNHEIEDRSDEF